MECKSSGNPQKWEKDCIELIDTLWNVNGTGR